MSQLQDCNTNTELIARLRLGASISRERKLNQGYDAVADQAADAIEALEAERDSLAYHLNRQTQWKDAMRDKMRALQAQLAAAQTEVERLNIYNSHLRGYNSRLQSKQMVVTDVAAIPQQPAQPVLRVIPTAQGVFPVWFDGAWRKSVYKYGTDYGTGIALYAAPIPQQVAEPEHIPLSDAEIEDLRKKANRNYCIDKGAYFKAFRDAEQAHGIKQGGQHD